MINYHEQHAYAYELFNFPRRDAEEIGPQFKGKGFAARENYITDISLVLINMKNIFKKIVRYSLSLMIAMVFIQKSLKKVTCKS